MPAGCVYQVHPGKERLLLRDKKTEEEEECVLFGVRMHRGRTNVESVLVKKINKNNKKLPIFHL